MDRRVVTGWNRIERMHLLGVAGLLGLVLAGVSAQAALRAAIDRQAPALRIEAAPEPAPIATDPIPGPAAAVAQPGATGTITLPDLPREAVAPTPFAPDASVHPAAPFALARASAVDRGRALQCLTAAIYYEAASEPDAGQQAVAQVILNRVRHPAFPATVCGVVYQGSDHAGCQFSFACDGAMARMPASAAWVRALRVAAAALDGHVMAEVGLATHYHTYAVTPVWNRSLVMTAAIGAHFFHRWQGWWGTPAAFRQTYLGGEPVPGPALRVMPAPVVAAATPSMHLPVTAPANVQPAYADSGTTIGSVSVPGTLPGDPQILDRWKDSGKPLK